MTDAALQSPQARRAGAILTIDLDALAANWKLYGAMCKTSGADVAAVVKACSYGLGIERAATALAKAGCTSFYVATIEEGIELRSLLGAAPSISVFGGLMDGAERDFTEHDLIPVLNSLGEIDAWRVFCSGAGRVLTCAMHIDSGMGRLGLDEDELKHIADNADHVRGLKLSYVLSHLAAAEEPGNPYTPRQLDRFKSALARIQDLVPGARASFANSAGVFLGADYHFDQVRPGVALYGVNPTPNKPNPMAQVVRLQGKILQTRRIDTPQGVGYGATHVAAKDTRIATIAAGYADGYMRSLSNAGEVYIGERKASVVGRVSMDLITIDVTDIPEPLTRPGQLVDLIGPRNPVDDVAAKAGTIGYEILTSLGARYHRIYKGG